MGLDMYMNKKTYIGANFEHRNVKGKVELTIGEKNQKIGVKLNRISEISEQVGYWRKANHIHNWFVENVQGGKDECQEATVSLEKLKELQAVCRKVLRSKAKAHELLPTQSGFFFGGTDYDEYYFNDVKDTLKIINPLIKELEQKDTVGTYPEVVYRSSW
jgi:hypothetical protein